MRIDIVKQIDKDTREIWGFNTFDFNAVFVRWHKEVKPKNKRKWVMIDFWDKYSRRHPMMSEEPILPEAIKSEALNELTKFVRVRTWDEWKSNT
jgi:hypothetical protein